ncbi:MAG TPA: VWA domain-containing protein [Pyrinomonadaceae bacterium]|nr:VWA domain-containing protein [Pyrinomonadaceae bacterium]
MRVLTVLLISLIFFPSAAVPQTNDPIILNLTVTSKKGTIIRGLTLENFSITVDKQPLKILSLNEREVPVSVGILIDTSGSQDVRGAVEIKQQFKQGLEGFFKLSNPANEYFALAFNTQAELIQDWTSDYQSIVTKVDSLIFKKPTALYDAMSLSLEKMQTSRNSKRVLVLISDGADNQSKASFKKVRDALKASDVILYCVGLQNVVGIGDAVSLNLEGEGILSELATLSGGRVLFMNNSQGPKAFNEVFEIIALELRSQYQIAIAPEASSAKTKWRKLKVTASRAGAEELMARTRQGYYR